MPAPKPSFIDGLLERERLAVDQLARGKTIREVARILGVSERTIWNYRNKPRVQRAIFNLQQELMAESGGHSIDTTAEAVQTLKQIINNPQSRDADRIAASRALLSNATSFAERKILERQLADLEKQLLSVLTPDAASPSPEDAPTPDELALLMPSASVDAQDA